MAQPWSLRYPLIDGQGNFGSTDGDPPAAMRYTEARPTGVASHGIDADLNLDTVDFQPNYDERADGADGSAGQVSESAGQWHRPASPSGMACNLLPHNLREICDAIVKVIDNPDVSLTELLEIVPGPDFPTGGIICGRDGIVEGYRTGRGRITLRAKIHVEEPQERQDPRRHRRDSLRRHPQVDPRIGRRLGEEGAVQGSVGHQR